MGFIGSHLVDHFKNKFNVTVIDYMGDGSINRSPDGYQLVKRDINDLPYLDLQPDLILHAAAESNVDKSINSAEKFIHSNVLGTLRVLEFARAKDCEIVYINSDEIYGPTETMKFVGDALNPTNPYSASKASAGHLCWAFANTYGLKVKEVRMCNVIGRRQADTKLIPRVLSRLKADQPIPLYDGGNQSREYIDVRDVCQSIDRVINTDKQAVFHITSNQEYTTWEVIKLASTLVGKEPIIEYCSRPGHDRRYCIGRSPEADLCQYISLRETMQWLLSDREQPLSDA